MKEDKQDRMEMLLKRSVPPVEADQEPSRDLWPATLRGLEMRLDTRPPAVPWFDMALAGGVLGLIALFPASIPVFLYYL